APTCSESRSRHSDTNCTPVSGHAGFPVTGRERDHKGVHFWTEFLRDRNIAMHQYDDQGSVGIVDGTPLSHGCVRLHGTTAKKIFCGVRKSRTTVRVQNLARPKCDWPALQAMWQGDFNDAGQDTSTLDGERQRQVKELRHELDDAFKRKHRN